MLNSKGWAKRGVGAGGDIDDEVEDGVVAVERIADGPCQVIESSDDEEGSGWGEG